jgi:hypothetical protein
VEADEGAGDADERAGDVALPGIAEARQPGAGIAVEAETDRDADDQDDDKVCQRIAADAHRREPLLRTLDQAAFLP